MEYRRADTLSARDHRFIADLMPRYPIYVSLLPEAARNVIARPHPDAEPAYAMLMSQGFRYNDVVDIFDAGPTVEAFIDHLDTVREARRMKGAEFVASLRPPKGLIANADLGRFTVTQFAREDDPAEVLRRISAGVQDDVLVYRLKGSKP